MPGALLAGIINLEGRTMDNVGVMIANQITRALAGKCGLSYDDLSSIVYGECLEIARNATVGDWVEMPNGATYTLTFKP